MFKPRAEEKNRGAPVRAVNMNRDVNVPLVKTQDGKEFDPKHKNSTAGSVASGADPEAEQAVQAQESKRRKRRILKIAVYCMFAIIALGVFAIWLFHKDSVESLRFGSLFLFTVKLRSLEVKDLDGDVVLYGDMGRRLLATPYGHCWDANYKSYEPDCLLWRDAARLHVTQDVPGNRTAEQGVCYTLRWVGLSTDFVAEDCFYLQRYHWYGVLTNHTPVWPIEGVRLADMTDYYDEYPHKQEENLVPIWYGSQGVAIFVDSSFPFSVGWNTTDKRQFCLTSKLRAVADQEWPSGRPRDLLRYTICQASGGLREVYRVGQEQRQARDTDFSVLSNSGGDQHQHLLLPRPIHALRNLSDLQELQAQLERGESLCSLFEMYDEWEEHFGDLAVERNSTLPALDRIIAVAERQDCHPIMPVSTFFSYNSLNFREGIDRGYFVRDRQNLATRMVQWREREGAVLDVTNPEAEDWFIMLVSRLVARLRAPALKLLHLSIPPDASYRDGNMTQLDYTRIFYRDLATLNVSLVLERATGFIPLPVYTPVRTRFLGHGSPAAAAATCLNTSVPASLMMGLSGYPLLIADADPMLDGQPTREMFMRWLQLAIFFPVLEIPSLLLLREGVMQNFLQKMLHLRRKELLPNLTMALEREPGMPLLRPLLWEWPRDELALTLSDQFLVGDRLLVAPVLCVNVTRRSVYLPEGSWRAGGRRGKQPILHGPRYVDVDVSNYDVIPFFWREREDVWKG